MILIDILVEVYNIILYKKKILQMSGDECRVIVQEPKV
jgi:hypothetical protein